jgi:serine/threonine-protein kinase
MCVVANAGEPARSRQMLRAPWGSGASEDEARAYLHARMLVLWRLMFWCFVVLVVFLAGAYAVYPEIQPVRQSYVYLGFAAGLVSMIVIQRVWLVRPSLSIKALEAIDTFYVVGSGLIIAMCAVASIDRRQAAYTCLLYACFAVLTRALIVPSTGRRTAIVTSVGFVPMSIGAVILAYYARWTGGKDVTPFAFLTGYFEIIAVAIVLSAAGSQIIYGLRRKVSAAQQLGKYTLVQQIGEGGMGVVYRANHLLLRRPTAVKLLHPQKIGAENLERFEREVQQMSRLSHPNTVAVYDYGHSPDGVFYYAMEYLGGGIDLDKLVKKHGKQPAERVRQILMQTCGALQEAHDQALIHRDIKPANIILCERGALPDVVKVVDFGLVKELTKDSALSQAVVLGTPGYVAPEAVTEPSLVGPGVDIYALGAVAYFLLAGRPVFKGKTVVDTCLQHVTKTPDPLVGVPAPLAQVVMHCLAKQPSERPASAAALAESLRALGAFDDWDEARAAAWWKTFASSQQIDATATPTLTITVELGQREVTP